MLEDILLLVFPEVIEVPDYAVCFRCFTGPEASAFVRSNRLEQVRRTSIMQKEEPLSQPPQWGCPKLSWPRLSLSDAVGQTWAHVVNQQVGEKVHSLVA